MGKELVKNIEQGSHVEVKRHASKNVDDQCVVCLEPVSERAITWPCNHYNFDFHCLLNWAEQRASCPLCKPSNPCFYALIAHSRVLGNSAIKHVEYDWRSPDDYQVYIVSNLLETKEKDGRQSHNRPSRPPLRQSRHVSRYSRNALQPDLALQRRKHVYRHNLYSLHVGSNRLSQYRDVTPTNFSRDKALQSRARAWIRRELHVFSFLGDSSNATTQTEVMRSSNISARSIANAEFLLEYIIALLKTIDLRGPAGQAEEMLQEFLGREHAKLFLHELNAWLRSPYPRVEDWDRMVQYRENSSMRHLRE